MENGMLVTVRENQLWTAWFEEGKIVQLHARFVTEDTLLGTIYVGKVKNIVQNIQAAFVEIADAGVCYLSMQEPLLPLGQKALAQEGRKLHIGDEILVQVATESIKKKPPKLTGMISLTGRYLVLTRGKTQIALSTKIQGEESRALLRSYMEAFENDEYGFIVRTNAKDAPKEAIIKEAKQLIMQYESITEKAPYRTCFSLVYQSPPSYVTQLRDGYRTKQDEIVTDVPDIYEKMREYMEAAEPQEIEKLKLYQDESVSLDVLYNLSGHIKRALSKNVWLKSGAGIVIEPTESLTAIDVNTGKAIKGHKNTEETFLQINMEAAVEIARQLRLRNLSGMIIVDFIDMKKEKNKEKLLHFLKEEVKKDPVKTMVLDYTALGLVELTRKRLYKPLHEMIKGT